MRTFCSLLLIICSLTFARGQHGIVKFNFPALLVGSNSISAEFGFSPRYSLQFTMSALDHAPYSASRPEFVKSSGVAFCLDGRRYLKNTFPSGIYTGPFIRRYILDSEKRLLQLYLMPSTATIRSWNLGWVFGRQFDFGTITLDIFGGPYFFSEKTTLSEKVFKTDRQKLVIDGMGFRAAILLGLKL